MEFEIGVSAYARSFYIQRVTFKDVGANFRKS